MSQASFKLTNRLFLVFVGAFALFVGVHLAGVALLHYAVERVLHPPLPQGTQIGEVQLNLFSGIVRIQDFELRDQDEQRIRVGQLDLDISPWRLLGGKLLIQRVRVQDGLVRVVRTADGRYDLGLPEFGDGETQAGQGEPPDVEIAEAALEGLDIEFRYGDFKALARVDSLRVGGYSTRAQSQEVPLSWQLTLDGREISGDAVLILDQGQFAATGELSKADLDLGRIQRLAALAPLVEGEVTYRGSVGWQAPELTLAGRLEVAGAAFKVADRSIDIRSGSFPDFALRLITAPKLVAELQPGSGSRIARVQWQTAERLAVARGLQISGDFRYEDDNLVNLKGLEFRAEGFDWQAGTQRAQAVDFALRGTLQQGIAGELRLPAADLQLSAAGIEYAETQDALELALERVELKGLRLRSVQQGEAGDRQLQGQLNIAKSRLGQGGSVVRWSDLTAGLEGTVGLTRARMGTELQLSALSLESPVLAHGPLQIARVDARGLVLGEESRLDRLQLQTIKLPGELPETGVQIAALSLSGGAYAAASGLDLGDIEIDGLKTAVIRDESSQWRHPGTAIGEDDPKPETGEAVTDQRGISWRVGSLKVTGDSYVISGDRTNPAATPLRNRIHVLTVGELASDRPGQDTPFEIDLRPDKYTSFQFKGVARPLADPVFLDAGGELNGLDMPRLNGFIANDLGHKFTSGQLDARFQIKIADNALKMGNFLELHKADAEALEGKEGPPLPTAIALLEDRDGYVKIEVPVEGRLDDPNFRVLAALNPVIMKAVAGTAALAIQPLGSVLLVGGLLADQALKVTFNPAEFDPGSVELNPAARKYLGELAKKLGDKPKLALRICGVAVDAERKKDDKGAYLDQPEQLLEMAQQRAQAVRAFMLGAGSGEKQLRSCRPSLDPQPEATPRVDIRL